MIFALGKKSDMAGRQTFDSEKVDWKKKLCLESFGVKIGIRSNLERAFEDFTARLPDILPNGWRTVQESRVEQWFSIYKRAGKSKLISFYKNSDLLAEREFDAADVDFLISSLRLTIAECAPRHVFLHAGAVEYKNRAIIIPGTSFSGKTTLVAELIRRGCRYYSDEYAVINQDGLLEPYPKKLSLRGIIDEYRQVDFPASELGGRTGVSKIPVGVVLVTEYRKSARFAPKTASAGEGVIAMIANSVSIRQNPEFVLKVLTPIANCAKIIKTKRGAAGGFARRLLEFIDREDAPEKNPDT